MTLDDLLERTGAHVAVGRVILFTPEKGHLVLATRQGDDVELTEEGVALVSELAAVEPAPSRTRKAKEAKISDLLD